MKWAGHMVRMKEERLPKRSQTKKQEGCRTRGRPQLRWDDCVKRDLGKAEEEEKWRKGQQQEATEKQITKVAEQPSDNGLTSLLQKGNQRKKKAGRRGVGQLMANNG